MTIEELVKVYDNGDIGTKLKVRAMLTARHYLNSVVVKKPLLLLPYFTKKK